MNAILRILSVEKFHKIFPWISNIYRGRIYLWNVSYAFRKTAHSSKQSASLSAAHADFLSEHLTGRAALNWNCKLCYYILRVFYNPSYKACLEQSVLCTYSAAVQSVSSFPKILLFLDVLISNSILTVFLHTVLLIKIYRTNSIYCPALLQA